MTKCATTENAERGEGYVLGVDEAELRRLGFQHTLWTPEAQSAWRRGGLARGARVLDVGCGPGYATRDMARLIGPEGRVLAVDESSGFLRKLEEDAAAQGLGNIETARQDVQALDAGENEFDFVYARWVLCFVEKPDEVVRRVARALRPGGSFVVQDYSNYAAVRLRPETPAFDRVIEATYRNWSERGGDPNVSGRVPGMMVEAGLRIAHVAPMTRAGGPSDPLWRWPETFFSNFIPKLIEGGYLTKADQDAYWEGWRERSADPASVFTTPPMLEIVGVKL